YELDKAVRPIGEFVDDLSNWYIRRSRDRFKSEGEDKENAIATTRFVMLELSKLVAPFVPFVAEEVYQEVVSSQPSVARKESVHLEDWASSDGVTEEQIRLMGDMEEVRKIVALGLEERAKAGIKVRQPLSELKVKSEKLKDKEDLLKLVKDEVNVKEIVSSADAENEVELDTTITPELKREGMARELTRGIQDLRKKAGMTPGQKMELVIETDSEGENFINDFMDEIKNATNVTDIKFSRLPDGEETKVENLIFKIKIGK
ncbi:MAG: class I tRNA ligase family protein, partial [bacterium]|nr:class I tRNA ligase family protein [bacterium]